ncbi:transcriptional regulator [Amycolatopsis thermophila]|uniref:Transcriptional regulator n=1 Tax=Amycolatopsis thermophila TaxID=206084 RepID=A0ABU0ERL5_9PSEU|nr:transcriptional regulator [Amycolatopsis thermophila]MDQ0377912.1 hypothetical protein [Amycolatopsis thermophila]
MIPLHTIKLRPGELDKAIRLKHFPSDYALARAMGVARSTVVRVRAGQIEPGPRFIAGALVAFPELRFEDLFEISATA